MSIISDTAVNNVMMIDGVMFIIPSLMTFISPSANRMLADKIDSKHAGPAMRDLRRNGAANQLALGIIMLGLGLFLKGPEINWIVKMRALSLVFIVTVIAMQITSKRWKKSGNRVMYLLVYSLLILAYIYFGFLEPIA